MSALAALALAFAALLLGVGACVLVALLAAALP